MHLFQILVPINLSPRKAASSKDSLEVIKKELTDKFGGVTAYAQSPAQGLWKKHAATERDRIVVVEVMSKQRTIKWWQRYRLELEKRLDQKKIVIRYFGIDEI